MIPSLTNAKVIRGYGAEGHRRFSEVQFYLHLRPVFLLARPGRHLKFSWKNFFLAFFFVKQIHRTQII